MPINKIIDDLLEDFDFFDAWEERYAYLIELGRALPPFPEIEKTDANKVQGCTSQVWLAMMPSENNPSKISFLIESDAHIVKGLAAILYKIFAGQEVAEIMAVDIKKFFADLGLDGHLSPTRSNGFYAMAQKIQLIAAEKLK
ncbi:MAG: SufE family protein [Alphaproteobacteria bacterium]